MGFSVGGTAKNIGKQTVIATSLVVESTEAFKKTFQVIKGILDLTGLFTNVSSLSPMITFAKSVNVVIGGTDIFGRIKDWVKPDDKGQTLAQKHWAKIISRIWLTFANAIDFYNMLKFFNIFKLIKLSQVAQTLGNMAAFKGLVTLFSGLDVIKNVFVLTASGWSILDSGITIEKKHQYLKHVKAREEEWEVLGGRGLTEQARFFDAKYKKYDSRLGKYKNMTTDERKNALKKLSRSMRMKVEKANLNAPKYKKLAAAVASGNLTSKNQTKLDSFFEEKAKKWHSKIKVVKIDFAKSAVSIACEVAKIFVVSMAIILFFTGVGSAIALPAVMIGLGLISNGLSLFKFLFDKLLPMPRVKKPAIPKLKMAAAPV